MDTMVDVLSHRLVPDRLWQQVGPLLPAFSARPQGGGSAPLDDRAVFTAVVYVLTSGCAWRNVPPEFGVSPATAHRRFVTWSRTGLWRRLYQTAADQPEEHAWLATIAGSALERYSP
ncbi:transposase [Catenulispora sp. NF23]|uniref:Transposase n=1 Tax=Catenulispora pinistramenti TaxID=2705254 RepID=A0ABS5L741_9ACTN|nr:transposase [Catenulispora pinistramenti]MBS2539633.1 transposase [Catenulispora pinistramenti]MBS2554142.1 transposase [Catenulispora pinistramenti]